MEPKTCVTCLIVSDDFQPRRGKSRKGKYKSKCRNCEREYKRNLYKSNKNEDPFTFKIHQVHAKQKDTNITAEFLKGIWDGKCAISGMPIKFYPSDATSHSDSAELDRFDPKKGYHKGNVSWVSRKYNGRKGNASVKEIEILLNWMKSFKPAKEAFSEIIEIVKPKRIPWNKGKIMPQWSGSCGSNHRQAKLTNKNVQEIRVSFKGKRGEIIGLARKYEVSASAISNIINNKTWRSIGE